MCGRFALPLIAVLTLVAGRATDVAADGQARALARWKERVLNTERLQEITDGEKITWFVTPYLRGMVLMAEATGDRECLDTFCREFERLQSLASTDIDGLFGWPTEQGSYGKHGPRCVIMDDAIISWPALRLVKIVRADPELRKVYGERAERYLKFIEEKLFPKWQPFWIEFPGKTVTLRRADGSWKRIEVTLPGPAGVYVFPEPGGKQGRSLPINQFLAAGHTYLELHDVTGRKDYLDRARELAVTARHVYLEPEGDRFRPWCYWQPVYEGDFESETQAKGWVGPHPKRFSYHAGEVSYIAALHRRKLVFTDDDMKRIVRLHLDVMWNGSVEHPVFGYEYGPRRRHYPARLWRSLAYFDDAIAKMADLEEPRRLRHSWQMIVGLPEYLLRQKEAHGDGKRHKDHTGGSIRRLV